MTPPCALVIFGASGDLVSRKLIPAIYDLAREGLFDERSYAVGFSRTEMSDSAFRKTCREAVEKYARAKPIDPGVWRSLESRIYYVRGNYGAGEDYTRLADQLRQMDERHGVEGNRLFYLATPPEQFRPVIEDLGRLAHDEGDWRLPYNGNGQKSFKRIIIEKPFGRDLDSARALNQLLHRYFREDQVFRIDHYLGKETVQNLLVMRFANSIFEPIWNYKYIDHVQITVAETLGVGSRGGYYDRAGAL
ncbi:MAG: glucose-6-phosphate dehydrogenase, partial [Bacillota bacterium]